MALSGDGGDRSSAGVGSSRSSGAGNGSASSGRSGSSGGHASPGNSREGSANHSSSSGRSGSGSANGGVSHSGASSNGGRSGQGDHSAAGRSNSSNGNSSSRGGSGGGSSGSNNGNSSSRGQDNGSGGRATSNAQATGGRSNVSGTSGRVGTGTPSAPVGNTGLGARVGSVALGSGSQGPLSGDGGVRSTVGAATPSYTSITTGANLSSESMTRARTAATAAAVSTPTGARPGTYDPTGSQVDPARFAGANTPTGFEAVLDRPQTAREAEISSMAKMAEFTRNETMKRAAEARAAENASMATYTTAKGRTDSFNAQGTGFGTSFRTSEAESMRVRAVDMAIDAAVRYDAGGPDPFNTMNGGAIKDLENMTVGEVMAMQKDMIAKGLKGKLSTAAGGMQVKQSTLAEAVARMGIDPNTKFDRITQRAIGQDLVDNRVKQSIVNGKVDEGKLATNLANEWAAFKDPKTGKGKFDNDGVNKASVKGSEVAKMAHEIAVAYNNAPQTLAQNNFNEKYLSDLHKADENRKNDTPAPAMSSTPTTDDNQAEQDYFGEVPGRADRPGVDDAIGGKNDPNDYGIPASPPGTFNNPNTPEVAAQPNPMDPTAPTGPYGVGVPNNRPKTNPNYKMGTPGEMVAGGIDLAVGMVPGVGQAASLYNAVATIVGIPTIGEATVNYVGRNPNQYEPGQTSDRVKNGGSGGGFRAALGNEAETVAAQVAKNRARTAATVKKPGATVETQTFEGKYLDDGVKRPTPMQKWYSGAEYGATEFAT